MIPVVVILGLAIVALLVVEFWYIAHGEQTISERFQRINQRLGPQLLAGIFFLLGALAGWFIAHFTSPPPV